MTTAALRREETKHTGRKLFQCLYKRLLLTGLLIEPVKQGRKKEQKLQSITLHYPKVSTAFKYSFDAYFTLKMKQKG